MEYYCLGMLFDLKLLDVSRNIAKAIALIQVSVSIVNTRMSIISRKGKFVRFRKDLSEGNFFSVKSLRVFHPLERGSR